MAQVFLVEDVAGVQEFVAMRLWRAGHDVIGIEADPELAAAQVAALRPDVCVIDIAGPAGSGLAAIGAVRSAAPGAEIIACTTPGGDAGILAAIRAGARDAVTTVRGLETALDRLDARLAAAGPAHPPVPAAA